MLTVKLLREILAKFPDNARCHAYEGEGTGIVISLAGEYGFIDCRDVDEQDTDVDFFPSGDKS